MSAPRVIGVDLGGTKILSGLVERDGAVSARRERVTPTGSQAELLAALEGEVAALLEARPAALGIGIPTRVDKRTGRAAGAVNLPLADVDVTGLLRSRFGLPVGVENDGSAAALAEWRLGAGRGAQDLVMLTLGTGVGGGLVLGGELHRGHRQAAGEIGHMVVEAGGPRCGCGRRGCVEAIASRTAIVAALREAVAAGRESSLAGLVAAHEAGRNRLRSGAISRAYRAGDPLTVEVLERAQRALGLLAGSLVNLLDPEVVVFGGGLIEALGPRFLAGIRRVAREHILLGCGKRKVRIVAAALGDDAVALGAARAALEAA